MRRSALIIEHAPGRRSLLSVLLQELGFPLVTEAASIEAAHERLERVQFDAVFVEVERASDAGVAFVRAVRAGRGRNYRTPIVIVSADSQRAVIESARDAGASGFLAKPFSRATLNLQIARITNDARTFIESETYTGPDRRRWNDPSYAGPERRGASSRSLLYID